MKSLQTHSLQFAALALCLTFCNLGWCQYPQLPTESLGNASYEWCPSLGGWRDRATNLVWGYSGSDTMTWNASYSFAITKTVNYPQYLFSRSQSLLEEAARAELSASTQTDPVRKQKYLDLAASKRADSIATSLAATDASQYTNWRAPTLAEFQSAWSKGLFARGAGAFNLDMTPLGGYQSGLGGPNWTSNPSTFNNRIATIFDITTGQSSTTGVSSSIRWIVVRTAQ